MAPWLQLLTIFFTLTATAILKLSKAPTVVQPLRHLQVVLVSNMIFSFNPFYFIFFCTAPSAPPENVTIIGSTPSSVDLLWDAPPFESQNGLIRRYIVEIKELETDLIFHLTTNSSNISVQNLLPFYNYTFAVALLKPSQLGQHLMK